MKPASKSSCGGFTLVEVIAATAILVAISTVLFKVSGDVSALWRESEKRVETFQGGRMMLELIARDLRASVVGPTAQMLQNAPLPSAVQVVSSSDNLFFPRRVPTRGGGDIGVAGYFLRTVPPAGSAPRRYQLMRLSIAPEDSRGLFRLFAVPPSPVEGQWVSGLPAPAFADAGDAAVDPAETASTVVSDGVLGFWVRCLDSNGQPIPWPGTVAEIRFNSARAFRPPVPGQGDVFPFAWLPPNASVLPVHRPPDFIEITLITVDSRTLARGVPVPALPQPASAADVSGKILEYEAALVAAGINSARKFTATIAL